MKKIFSKIGILAILIFSFLLSFFQTTPIKAANDTIEYQTYVNVSYITRKDNLITVNLLEEYDVIDFTYEYTYYLNEILVSELVKNSIDFQMIDKTTFTFSVNKNVEGVKLWKVKYLTSNNIWADKQCKGGILSVGNMNSSYKKNYVVIEDNLKLVKTETGRSTDGTYSFINYKNVVHFNFKDLVVDEIEKITLDYSQYTHKEYLWNLYSKNTNHKNIADYEVEKEDYIVSGGLAQRIIDKLGLMTAKRYKIQKSDLEGYDWAVELPTTSKRMDATASTRIETIIQNASVTKISYWSEGQYYEDIPVLGSDTGWVYATEKEPNFDFWKWLIEMINKIVDFFGGNVVAVIIFFVIVVFIIVSLIKLGIKKTFQGIFWIIEKIVSIIISLLKFIICLPFVILKKIFGKKQE